MHNGVGFNHDDEKSWADGSDIAPVERVNGTTRLSESGAKRRHQLGSPIPSGAAAAIGDEEEGPLERVGRRHLVRPELGALVVGAVFIFAALLKPWGAVSPTPSPSASASQTAVVVVQGAQVPPLPAYLADLSRGWAGVDWSFLGITDGHVGWGISAATMAEVKLSAPRATPHDPSVAWTPVPTSTPATVLDVGPDIGVFALAVTWPQDVRVTDITVEYLGSGYAPPYLTSGGFQPYTQLSPLSADSLLGPQGQPTTQGAPRSGEFWVPPAIASPVTADRSASVAWHQLPWPWPLGGYKITVTSQNVPTVLALFLRQTPGLPTELTPTSAPLESLLP
jgi:hypothetical protein